MPVLTESPNAKRLGYREVGKHRLSIKLGLIATLIISTGYVGYLSSSYTRHYLSFTKASTTMKEKDPKIQDSKTRTHAVIHMGIRKTGSTSIQAASIEFMEALAEDGYETPLNETSSKGQRFFAGCFLPAVHGHECGNDFLSSGLDIARRNRNLLVSFEGLALADEKGLAKLASYLSHWDEVTIVVYYRRFYEWLASNYQQSHRNPKRHADKRDSIIDYIRSHEIGGWASPHYAVPLVDRLQKQFSDIVVMNYHVKSAGGTVESFFCNAMNDASNTCNAIRADKSYDTHQNVAMDPDHFELVIGAGRAGLLKIDSAEELEEFARAVGKYHRETLNATNSSFRRQCLPASTLDSLWRQSLAFETALFPQQVESPGYDLKSEFDKCASSILCKLEVESILGEERWKSFFRNLGQRAA